MNYFLKMYLLLGNDKLTNCLLTGVLVRPLEITDATQLKIRVLQFLSRINEGEHLGEIILNSFITADGIILSVVTCIQVCEDMQGAAGPGPKVREDELRVEVLSHT